MSRQSISNLSELQRLHKFKSGSGPACSAALGEEMIQFFKQSVAKRQTKLARLAECWGRLVPDMLNQHCALESFSRGALTIIVDSSSHLYELKQLMLSGMHDQLLIACKSAGLRKITLKPGRWYDGDNPRNRQVRFQKHAARSRET